MSTTITSREFNQDTGRAKRAAKDGPVFITDRGRPSLVLLKIQDYQALTGRTKSLAEALGMEDGGDIEFEPPRMGDVLRATPFDFD